MIVVLALLGLVGAVAIGVVAGRFWELRRVAALDAQASATPANGRPDPGDRPLWRPTDDGSLYDVVLLGAKYKLSAIRAVRAAPPDVGLIAARQMIERLPVTLRAGVSSAEAARLRAELEKLGGRIDVRPVAVAVQSDGGVGSET